MKEPKCLYLCFFLTKVEPSKVFDALKDADWIVAMQEKLNQFERLKVWRLFPCPANKTIIGTKCIFKNKKDENGLVVEKKLVLLQKDIGKKKE